MMTDSKDPPKATKADVAHKAAKIALSAVPVVGGPAAELFASLILPPLERRRDEWMKSVGEALGRLEAEGKINLNELRDNDEFVDTVLQATQVALRNHQEEKRRALKAAILNTAEGRSPGESLRQVFLRYVDEFTEWHLRVLDLFHDPSSWYQRRDKKPPDLYMGGLSSILENAFPQLQNARAIYDQIWADLYQRGLVNTEGLHTTMSGHGLFSRRTSDLGARFLSFIQEPGG